MESEINAFLGSLEADPAYSESTQLAYANDLRVFLRYLISFQNHDPGLNDLNARQVINFLEAESRQGRSRNTLIRRLATLTYFQDFLVKEGKLETSFFSGSDGEIQRVIIDTPERNASKCLEGDQIHSVLSVMTSTSRPRASRDRAIFMLLLETGLSVADLISLDMTDLDLNAGRFHVYLDWEGDVWLDLGKALQAVEDYVFEGRPNLLHKPGEPALFISQMDGRLSRQGVWQILQFWGRQANPPVQLSPRLVRHTAVLRMKNEGLSMEEIQMRLGHSNLLSTQALIRRLEAGCGENNIMGGRS